MKKIVVPFDFSETATQAFKFAIDVAEQSRGEVILLHVVELSAMYDTMLMPALSFEEAYLKDVEENAAKSFEKLIAKHNKEGVKISWHVAYGTTALSINTFAEEKEADLIVMGTKGASGIKELVIGSNTEKIVRSSPIPVIAIKKNLRGAIKNIVFPNALDREEEGLVSKIKALQKFFDATLHIVFINTPANFRRDIDIRPKLNAFVKRYMIKDCTVNIYNDQDQESGLINFAKEVDADMVAMGTHGRTGISHLMSGSIAEDVVNHIECPIWTFKSK
ncbi:MAG: universal stress protein [Bacteroidetes bacterium]|nr:universal stress protein [Bacteroidota bacterium]